MSMIEYIFGCILVLMLAGTGFFALFAMLGLFQGPTFYSVDEKFHYKCKNCGHQN